MVVNPVWSNRMKNATFIFLFIVLISMPLMQGCKTMFVNSPEKKAQKQQEKSDKAFEKNYKKIQKMHFKNQDRQTRKRMKKSKKEARKMNRSKKTKSKWDCN